MSAALRYTWDLLHSNWINSDTVLWTLYAAVVQFGSTFHSTHWGHSFCAECLDCAQSKETPSAFHVTEAWLCFPFLTVTFPLSLWFHRASQEIWREEREKDGSRGKVKNTELYWPASNSSEVIYISLYNVLLLQCDQTLFSNTTVPQKHNKQRGKVRKFRIDVRQQLALSGWVSQQCWSERQKARTSLKHCRAPLNLLSQIANLSRPPPESKFITYTNSNNNTDGFVPARQHRTVNLNKNTTSKRKHSLVSGIHAIMWHFKLFKCQMHGLPVWGDVVL